MQRHARARILCKAAFLTYIALGLTVLEPDRAAASTARAQRVTAGPVARRVTIPGTWSELTEPGLGVPVAFVANNLIAVVSYADPQSVSGFDLRGHRLWTIPIAHEDGGFALTGDDLIFTARLATSDAPDSIVDVDVATGKTRWADRLDFAGLLASDERGTVVSADGLVAFDRAGKELWHTKPAGIDRRIFFADDLVVGLGSIPGADDEPERGADELSSFNRSDGTPIASEEIPSGSTFRGTHALAQYSNAIVKGFPAPDSADYTLQCCAMVRTVIDLRRSAQTGATTPAFVSSSDVIAPDPRENIAISKRIAPCPNLYGRESLGVIAAGDADVFYVGEAHRIYALGPSGIRGNAIDDTCPTSLGSIGPTTIVWHAGKLALLSSESGPLALEPLGLPLRAADVVASLTGAARFYFSTTSHLYAIEPATGRERVWPVSCPLMAEPAQSGPTRFLECGHPNGKLEFLDLQ